MLHNKLDFDQVTKLDELAEDLMRDENLSGKKEKEEEPVFLNKKSGMERKTFRLRKSDVERLNSIVKKVKDISPDTNVTNSDIIRAALYICDEIAARKILDSYKASI